MKQKWVQNEHLKFKEQAATPTRLYSAQTFSFRAGNWGTEALLSEVGGPPAVHPGSVYGSLCPLQVSACENKGDSRQVGAGPTWLRSPPTEARPLVIGLSWSPCSQWCRPRLWFVPLHMVHALNSQSQCDWLVTGHCYASNFAQYDSQHSTLTRFPWEQI